MSDDDEGDVAFEGRSCSPRRGLPGLWNYEVYSVADYTCMNMALGTGPTLLGS